MVKDYHITVTVKNNTLLTVMRNQGFETAVSLARVANVHGGYIGQMLRLEISAINRKTGEFKPNILRVARALRTLPEELFPSQHLEKPLSRHKASFCLDRCGVENLITNQTPESLIELKETKKIINLELANLKERTKAMVEHRFGLNGHSPKTYDQCGALFNISGTRVKQLIFQALGTLKKTSAFNELL